MDGEKPSHRDPAITVMLTARKHLAVKPRDSRMIARIIQGDVALRST
jgi:hypothetical protein